MSIKHEFGVSIDWLLDGDGEMFTTAKPSGEQKGEGPPITDEDPEVADLLEGARRVLKSGNPIAFDALERNIRYFDHAVATEKRLEALEAKMSELLKLLPAAEPHRKAANE